MGPAIFFRLMNEPNTPRTPTDPERDGFPPTFRGVMRLIDRLRGPEGCPWDREQTPRSLLPHLLEEAHEMVAAIEMGDEGEVIDELGDLLLHLAFQIAIAEEEGRFDLSAVAGGIIQKMIHRHPHVFQDSEFAGSRHQDSWERLKRQEKLESGAPPGDGAARSSHVLGDIPRSTPALIRAYRLQQKAASIGFDWETPSGARDKVVEELEEVERASPGQSDSERLEEEFGDLLFSVVNWGRLLNVHPDLAMRRANRKFEDRFRHMEELAHERASSLEESSPAQLNQLWERVKSSERNP